MKKAASVFLCADINSNDIMNLIKWLQDESVTQFLNEYEFATAELNYLYDNVPEFMYTFHLNHSGRFFMIYSEHREPIGFLRFNDISDQNACEIVFAIGEKHLWGHGYGKSAVGEALKYAFFERRVEKVIANIYKGNLRSMRTVSRCGFRPELSGNKLTRFTVTSDDFISKAKIV
ncbi:MAG: GNAT family N-acetyltransferase [Oscillospiraceae bacterium]|nr:GNAT family N-acetyltransferase [Oscillospiraceae bacterium]